MRPAPDFAFAHPGYGTTHTVFKQLYSQTQLRDLAAHCAQVLLGSPTLSNQRAQGMPGARCARSLACSVKNTRVSHHGHTGNTRHSPRNGFNGFLRALPGDRACLPPSLADCSANLTPASGRQDHTTSPSASASPVKRASASIASRPASVTSRAAPLKWDRTAGDIGLSRASGEMEYFS